jgi:hypothetical protein
MGEIKSTMDIIMEKTKGLTMTDEEKQKFRRQEMEGKIKGLIQKYVDGLMGMERLKEAIAKLRARKEQELEQLIRKETMALIQPGESNAPLLEILSSVVGMDPDPIVKLLDDFDSKIEYERVRRAEVLQEELRKKGISGSALIPNIEADPEWRQRLSEMKRAFKEEAMRSVTEMENHE